MNNVNLVDINNKLSKRNWYYTLRKHNLGSPHTMEESMTVKWNPCEIWLQLKFRMHLIPPRFHLLHLLAPIRCVWDIPPFFFSYRSPENSHERCIHVVHGLHICPLFFQICTQKNETWLTLLATSCIILQASRRRRLLQHCSDDCISLDSWWLDLDQARRQRAVESCPDRWWLPATSNIHISSWGCRDS